MELSLDSFQLIVFTVNNTVFEPIGELNQFSSVLWPKSYQGFSDFELWAPITEENNTFFKSGNILWKKNTDEAVVIEIVEPQIDEDGNKSYSIRGRTLESILCSRIIWKTYSAENKKASSVMYEIVSNNCVNPTDTKRKIPYLELDTDSQIGNEISYQGTGVEVYDALLDISTDSSLGFKVKFDPINKKMIFSVYEGLDRTINQLANNPVQFSSDIEDTLTSSYYLNSQDYKTTALVGGEGEGKERKYQDTGNLEASGLLRKEVFVDASSIVSTSVNEKGEEVTVSVDEYNKMLKQAGDEKLSEYIVTETFEATIRMVGNVHHVLGVDYNLGDIVTIIDKQLGVLVSARITQIIENISENYGVDITFGYSYPTIFKKVKRML